MVPIDHTMNTPEPRTETAGPMPTASPVLQAEELVAYQSMLRRLPITDDVVKLAVKLASATRPGNGADAAKWVRWGAGPRASQYLALGARARAALRGHEVATTADLIGPGEQQLAEHTTSDSYPSL